MKQTQVTNMRHVCRPTCLFGYMWASTTWQACGARHRDRDPVSKAILLSLRQHGRQRRACWRRRERLGRSWPALTCSLLMTMLVSADAALLCAYAITSEGMSHAGVTALLPPVDADIILERQGRWMDGGHACGLTTVKSSRYVTDILTQCRA